MPIVHGIPEATLDMITLVCPPVLPFKCLGKPLLLGAAARGTLLQPFLI